MDRILQKNRYDQIVIYRHVNPDLDAFGAQIGMYYIIQSLFPNTPVVLAGQMEHELLKLFPTFTNSPIIQGKTLGIVLDTANRERIDGDLSICDYVIKIDHHIVVDSYGDVNIEYENASSCCEIVALLCKEAYISLSYEAASALYLGIVGDSNRFMYSSTTKKTFEAAIYLLKSGIHIDQLYERLYMRSKKDIEVTRFIYQNYQEKEGIAWYYLSDLDLQQLGIDRSQGSSFVNLLANVDDFKVWMAITENKEEHNYRVSIRSRHVPVNEVASLFKGGGHAYASGATLDNLEELDLLIEKLKEKMNE